MEQDIWLHFIQSKEMKKGRRAVGVVRDRRGGGVGDGRTEPPYLVCVDMDVG
jgi:hypothetical protein